MMDQYANIIVDISHEKVDRTFQYRIPPSLRDFLEVGMSVSIPFGSGNKLIQGYVMEITEKIEFDVSRIKEIDSIIDNGVTVESTFIRLAYWIKKNYGSTMIAALKTVLPVKQKMKSLEKKNIICLVEKKELLEFIDLFQKKHQVAKVRLLMELLEVSEIPYALVTSKIHVTGQTIKALENQGIVKVTTQDVYRNPVHIKREKWEKKSLSKHQNYIVTDIIKDFESHQNGKYLIHGITGSGKTEVYMELIEKMIAKGKQAIVLIPEIALTYQTVKRFYQRFGERVTVVNSKLSPGEKFDQFERAKKNEVDVVIGPRSALFTPFQNLGIIIIDEEHEGSYKSETMPKYHAREVAIELASYHHGIVVLGSATPSLESYHMAEVGIFKMYELKERLTGGTLPHVFVEDLREELKSGNRTMFSRRLYELMDDRLRKKEQIILFLNRRGYAGFVSCRACGHVMKCPHCDVSLSEHKNGKLVCHYCGYYESSVSKCPECGSKYILGFKAGTQQVEEMLWREFPHGKTLRMDADTTKTKDSYETILSKFAQGEADILVGTQMIVKGHDFPNVTLVGILAADMSLYANDYRAGERTFQLLTQAAGRAGRGLIPGEVVIQTYQPDHYSIIHAANQDYKSFYEEEYVYRELLKYPPAAHMMAILVLARQEEKGNQLAKTIGESIRKREIQNTEVQEKVVMMGPAPASIGKIKDIYRTVIYVKHKDYEVLTGIKDDVEEIINALELKNEIVQFDFDPMNT
ncbi:MAG TPA: primosomal protein N' [Lachnospiraceae bacterium]|nr:primosomal protein N' [Lachnospiraceae bacterium]